MHVVLWCPSAGCAPLDFFNLACAAQATRLKNRKTDGEECARSLQVSAWLIQSQEGKTIKNATKHTQTQFKSGTEKLKLYGCV